MVMFYNGFNLLIDILLIIITYKATRYLLIANIANYFYEEGQDETLELIDKGKLYKQECDGKMLWTYSE
jgi:hypothetical protein